MDGSRDSLSPTLSSLPDDILVAILAKFCAHCCETYQTPYAFNMAAYYGEPEPWPYSLYTQALHSMCLASSRFRYLAQRILYHEFIPGYGDPLSASRYVWESRLVPFLRTVARRADLAALVQRVRLDLELLIDMELYHVGDVLREVAQSRGVLLLDFLAPFKHDWMSKSPEPYQPSGDELITMLLACLPNLSRLILSSHAIYGAISASALRAVGVTRLPIHTIDACGARAVSGGLLHGTLEMSSTALTTLNVDYGGRNAPLLRDLVSLVPSLKHVCITRTECTGSDLASLLSRCAGLQSFVFESPEQLYPHTQPCEPILPAAAVEQLVRNKETLETLHLDLQKPPSPPLFDENEIYLTGLIPKLRDFPVLRSLSLNAALIYGRADGSPDRTSTPPLDLMLPPSLVSLRLADMVTAPRRLALLARDLRRVAEAAVRGQFPSLRAVRYDLREDLEGDGLPDLFARAGIDFGYRSWRLSGNEPRFRPRQKLLARAWG